MADEPSAAAVAAVAVVAVAAVPAVTTTITTTTTTTATSNTNLAVKVIKPKSKFICGVVEGFYGRPWTTEQRKDLFRKLKRYGMDSYVYAPKDDCKHRAFWRDLYTVEEADHLSGLITAAKEHNITFYYALSPGLDMTYSNPKEVATLKRKLEQVSQFGCEAFALLFDDIEPEMSKTDKEVFQTFAQAQVSVTNEIYNHLKRPRFLFCPTQYCSTRAVPSVANSEYLSTLGTKLESEIDILWTGSRVISKQLTVEGIEEITEVLRRAPVIWDNLHANDYDQKRVFLGPYNGRSPELIPSLHGILTNPNCEYHANTIAILTLAHWSKCSSDSKINTSMSADIKLERENEEGICDEEVPVSLSKNVYHPRLALKNAINEWLPEFFIPKEAWGPLSKPHPPATMVMPIMPIIPSVNTCMSLTTTTTTISNSNNILKVPEVNTTQLQALADVCSTVTGNDTPMTLPVMNSLVSATKVVTNDAITNPIVSSVQSSSMPQMLVPVTSIGVPFVNMNGENENKHEPIDPNDSRNNIDNDINKIEMDDNTDDQMQPLDMKLKIDEPMPLADESNEKEMNCEDADITEEIKIVNDCEQKSSADENNIDLDIKEELNINDASLLAAGAAIEAAIVGINSDIINNSNIHFEDEKINIDCVNAEDSGGGDIIDVGGGNNSMTIDDNNIPSNATEPMECTSSNIISSPKNTVKLLDDVIMSESISTSSTGSMQVENNETSSLSNADMIDDTIDKNDKSITAEDLFLLCDLFYLPFEHGSRGLLLLNEFYWLKLNATVLVSAFKKSIILGSDAKPEVQEWYQRSEKFFNICQSITLLAKKLAVCVNKELSYDLFAYVWDIAGVVILMCGYIKWLGLGYFHSNINTFTQGSYTWFSKGWKETFASGDQEPWVFRGGLIADLQRLIPVDAANDLFLYKLPDVPSPNFYTIRPYNHLDEEDLYSICFKTLNGGCDTCQIFPDAFKQLPGDRFVGAFTTLYPELCLVIQNSENQIAGFACAALDTKLFYRNQEMSWITEMKLKYPLNLLDVTEQLSDVAKETIKSFHNFIHESPSDLMLTHPSKIYCCILKDQLIEQQCMAKRIITVLLAALRANGSFGAHVCIHLSDTYLHQFYTKLGFIDIYHENDNIYLGRTF